MSQAMKDFVGWSRLGIAGGSFNPVHFGHLLAARAFQEQFLLERVMMVPSARPPHKDLKGMAAEKHRYIMTRMAVCDDPVFEVSDIEMTRPGLSFTVDTVAYLRRVYPQAALHLLLGLDAALQISTWKEPERLASLCHRIVIVNRPGCEPSDWEDRIRASSPLFAGKIRHLEIPAVDISSTDIRQRISNGQPVSYLLPAAVEEYISLHGLYREEMDAPAKGS